MIWCFYFVFRDVHICITAQKFVSQSGCFFLGTGVIFPTLPCATDKSTTSVLSVLTSVLFFSKMLSHPASSLGILHRVARKNWRADQVSWMSSRPSSYVGCCYGVTHMNFSAAWVSYFRNSSSSLILSPRRATVELIGVSCWHLWWELCWRTYWCIALYCGWRCDWNVVNIIVWVMKWIISWSIGWIITWIMRRIFAWTCTWIFSRDINWSISGVSSVNFSGISDI